MIRSIQAFIRKQSKIKAWDNLLKETVQTQFFRQGVRMSFWRIIALAFSTVASIWAARCLGPENLGISGMILTTIGQLALIINVSPPALLIRLHKKQPTEEAKTELISTLFTFRFTLCLLITLLVIPIILWLKLSPKWYVGLIAGVPYFFFTVNLADWILVSKGQMSENYKAITVQAVTMALLYFIFFRPGIGPGYDIAVQAIGFFLSYIVAWRYAVGKSPLHLYRWNLLPKIIPILIEGRWLTLMSLVVYIYVNLESPLLGYLYSIKELGIYRTATSLVGGFQALLAMIPVLLYPRFIDWGKQGSQYLWDRQKKIALALSAIFAPISIAAFLLAPTFYHYAYSPAFVRAAYPFAILLTSKFVVVINSIFSLGLLAQSQDKSMLFIMMGVAVTSLTLNIILIPYFGVIAAASVNLTSEVTILIGAFIVSQKIVRQHTILQAATDNAVEPF